jgi:hypothetical protein
LIDESAIAARRYRQFKKERGKGSIKKKITSIIVQVLMAVLKLLSRAKILRRRKVENVTVE